MTCSIGFRAPARRELGAELLLRMVDELGEADAPPQPLATGLYRHSAAGVTRTPGAMPASLQNFARESLQWKMSELLNQPHALARALGEWATEPKTQVWFERGPPWQKGQGLRLAQRTRMMYDDRHVFVNGEAFVASGRDALSLKSLADQRTLTAAQARGLSAQARGLLSEWTQCGWLEIDDEC